MVSKAEKNRNTNINHFERRKGNHRNVCRNMWFILFEEKKNHCVSGDDEEKRKENDHNHEWWYGYLLLLKEK